MTDMVTKLSSMRFWWKGPITEAGTGVDSGRVVTEAFVDGWLLHDQNHVNFSGPSDFTLIHAFCQFPADDGNWSECDTWRSALASRCH